MGKTTHLLGTVAKLHGHDSVHKDFKGNLFKEV